MFSHINFKTKHYWGLKANRTFFDIKLHFVLLYFEFTASVLQQFWIELIEIDMRTRYTFDMWKALLTKKTLFFFSFLAWFSLYPAVNLTEFDNFHLLRENFELIWILKSMRIENVANAKHWMAWFLNKYVNGVIIILIFAGLLSNSLSFFEFWEIILILFQWEINFKFFYLQKLPRNYTKSIANSFRQPTYWGW